MTSKRAAIITLQGDVIEITLYGIRLGQPTKAFIENFVSGGKEVNAKAIIQTLFGTEPFHVEG